MYLAVSKAWPPPRPITAFTSGSAATNNAFGYDLGGGVSGFFSHGIGVRGDLRHLHTFQDVAILRVGPINLVPNEKLDFWRASIGVVFRF